jgi:hypothetical protein
MVLNCINKVLARAITTTFICIRVIIHQVDLISTDFGRRKIRLEKDKTLILCETVFVAGMDNQAETPIPRKRPKHEQ